MADDIIVSDSHRDYSRSSLNERNIRNNPFDQFKLWFEEALSAGFLDANAMVLSTATKAGKPSSRVVLLKSYNDKGFNFFTNYESRKGEELLENPYASLLFFWDKLERQVRIEGIAERLTPTESDEYYQTRPYLSRLGAWASKQSKPLATRFKLMREVAALMLKFPVNTPLPPYWGGYRLVPDKFEFWQGRQSRLHDRFEYTRNDQDWSIERLYP